MSTRTFDTLLKAYSPEIQLLARETKAFILRFVPDAREAVDAKGPYVFYSYGEGYAGLVCSMILSNTGAKIGLPNSSRLADPDGLLDGTGKVHRHVVIKAPADLRRPGLRRLMAAHLKAWRARTAAKS